MDLAQEYEAWKQKSAPAADLTAEYEAWKAARPSTQAPSPAPPAMDTTATERALAVGDIPSAVMTSLAQGVGRGAAPGALKGFAKGLGAGAIETVGQAYQQMLPADPANKRAVEYMQSLAGKVEGAVPAAGAARRARAEELQAIGAGKTVAAFAAAPVTIPLAVGQAGLRGGKLLGQLIAGEAGWGETKAYAGEQWDLVAGFVPGYHAGAELSQVLRDPGLDEDAKAVYIDDWMRTRSAGEVAAFVGAAAAGAKGLRQSREQARAWVQSVRAAREAPPQEAMEAARPAPPPAPPPAAPPPAAPPPQPVKVPETAPLPVQYEAWKAEHSPTTLATGREGVLKTPAGDYRFRYELVPAASALPSHDGVSFERKTDYPVGVQERAYHRDPAEQGKLIEHSQRYDPRFVITDTPDAVNGPPVVASGRAIGLGGNSRLMTHQRLIAGLGRPGALEDYYTELLAASPRFGLDDGAVRQAIASGQPVELVRRLLDVAATDVDGMREAARRFNLDFKQAVEPTSAAVSRARALSHEAITGIGEALAAAGEDVTLREALRSEKVEQEIVRLLREDKVIPASEINKYVVAGTGRLNPAGVDMVESVLAGSVIPDADLLSVAPKAQINKVVKSLPSIAQSRSFAPEWDLSGDLEAAIRHNVRMDSLMAQTGLPREEVLNQQGLFGTEAGPSTRQAQLADALRVMKPTEFVAAMRKYAADAARATDKQIGMGLFPDAEPVRSPAESLAAVMGRAAPPQMAAYEPVSAPAAIGGTWQRPLDLDWEGWPGRPISTELKALNKSLGRYQGIAVAELDTAKDAQQKLDLGGAARFERGRLVGWYITPNPESVQSAFRGGSAALEGFTGAKKTSDYALGPGLYVSGIPGYWEGEFSRRTTEKPKFNAVVVEAEGRFVGLNVDQLTSESVKTMRDAGYQGAFVHGDAGMPKLVIWDMDAVRRVGGVEKRQATEPRRAAEREAVLAYEPEGQELIPKRHLAAWGRRGTPADVIREIWDPTNQNGIDSMKLFGVESQVGAAKEPTRAQTHLKILRRYMKKGERPAPGEPQQFVALAGGWGSGKTTTRKKMLGQSKFVDADPDAIKENLGEYRANPAAPAELLATFVHEESAWLAKAISFTALRAGLNTLHDSSGAGSTLPRMFQEAKQRGASTLLLYVEADPALAFMSAQERAKRSRRRKNTPKDLYVSHRDAAAAALRFLNDSAVDEAIFTYRDPAKKEPTVILRKQGGQVTVERPDLLKKIEEKSTMSVEDRVHDDLQSGRIVLDDGGAVRPSPGEAARPQDLGERAGYPAGAGQGPPVEPRDRGGSGGVGGGRQAVAPATQFYEPLRPNYKQPPAGTPAAGEIKSRQHIISELERRLNVPIRLGKTGRHLGLFKLRPEVARIKFAQDIDAVAHEVGHFLEKRLWGGQLTDRNMPITPGFKLSLLELADAVKKKTPSEGWAEFIHSFITDPARAKKYDVLWDYFQDVVSTKFPDIVDALRLARDDLQRLEAAPATSQILADVSFDPKKDRAVTWNDLYTQTLDDLHPIRAIVDAVTGKKPLPAGEDPYVLHRLLRGWRGHAEMFLEKGTTTFENPLDAVGKSFREVLAPVWSKRKDFTAYILARASKEAYARRRRQAKKGEPQIREHPVPWSEELVAAGIKEQASPAFEKGFERLQTYQHELLNYVRAAGGLSSEQLTRIEAAVKEHVPFFRVVEGQEGRPYSIGSKSVNMFAPIKRFFGSTREIIDPLESIYKNTLTLINWAERNHAATKLIDLIESHEGMGKYVEKVGPSSRPVRVEVDEVLKKAGLSHLAGTAAEEAVTIFRPTLWEKEPNTVVIWKDGKPVTYRVHPDLYRAVMGLDREHSGFWFRLMRFPAATLRAGATLTWSFIMRNPVRDQFSAFTNTKYGYVPGIDFVKGLYHALMKDDAYWDYRASGAAYSELVSLDRAYLQGGLNELMRSKMSKTAHLLLNPLALLQVASRLGEEATRIGELQKGLAAEGRSREGASAAAYSAREVTLDFPRVGAKMAALNHIAAFWNAGLQGIDRPIRAFKDAPAAWSARVAAGVTLPAVLLYLVNKDEEWYKNLPPWEKDIYYHFEAGGIVFRVPKPFELGILFASFPERLMRRMVEKDPHAFDRLEQSLLRTLPNPLPTGAIPIIENATNHSFFFDRKVVPDRLKDVAPKYQYGPYTSEVAKKVGAMTGTAPLMFENLVRGYTGGAGMAALHVLDVPIAGAEGVARPAKTAAEIALPGFVSKYPTFGSEPIERFYRGYEQSREALTTTRELIKRGEKEEGRTYGAGHRIQAKSAAMYQKMARRMSALSQEANAVAADPNLDGITKRRRLDEIAAEKTELARQFMSRAESRGAGPQ